MQFLPGEHQSPRLHRLQDIIRSLELPVLNENQCYSPSSMTKSSNKGQTVGENYSGIEFLQTPSRTPASGSPLKGTPVPRNGVFRVRSQDRPLPSGNGKLPIRRTFHISKYGRV
ncbi:hypothetical protein F2Q70_00003715 [Brassica cretica]|uniref:Uncharacterized protein n=1 Tax=Brassica cretica TaxID=69181 RepID=A0A8S9J1Y7_BRACR|nr:hypothetical protein F2Q70_00003715 [Brassica cretica]